MAFDIIYKGQRNGQQVDFQTGSLTDISTFTGDVRGVAIQNVIDSSETSIGASQAAIHAMSGYLASNAHPIVVAATDTGLDLSDGNVIQDISFEFDGSGHVTDATFTSVDLDSRYTQTGAFHTSSGHLVTYIDAGDLANKGYIDVTSGKADANKGYIDITSGKADANKGYIDVTSGKVDANKGYIDNVSGLADINAADIDTLSGLIDSVEAYDLQAVTDNGAFTNHDIEVSGLRISGDGTTATITGPATLVLDPDNGGPEGLVIVQGDLQVQGTTTTISSTDVQVGDLNLTLGTGANNAQALAGGGLQLSGVEGLGAEFVYFNDGTDSGWTTNGLDITANLDGTATGADRWVLDANISLGGDLQGSVSFNAAASAELNATINTDAIETSMILDDAVNGDKIAADSISGVHYVDASIENAHLVNTSVSITGGAGLSGGGNATLGGSAVTLSISAGDGLTANTDTLDINLDGSTLAKSANGLKVSTITSSEIAADAIDGTKIADFSIDSEHIATGAIDNVHIANGTIANGKLVNSSIGITAGSGILGGGSTSLGASSELNVNTDNSTLTIISDAIQVKNGGINTTQLANDAVDGTKIASFSIDSEHVATGAIDNVHIANSTIANGKLVNSSITITAGDGLAGGGDTALGGSAEISVSSDQGHLDEVKYGEDSTAIAGGTTLGGILILRGTGENGITTNGVDGNAISLANNTTVAFEGIAQTVDRSADNTDDGGYSAMWKYQGAIRRDGGGQVTMLSSHVTKVWAGSSASDYLLSVASSSDGLEIKGYLEGSDFGTGVLTSSTMTYNSIIEG